MPDIRSHLVVFGFRDPTAETSPRATEIHCCTRPTCPWTCPFSNRFQPMKRTYRYISDLPTASRTSISPPRLSPHTQCGGRVEDDLPNCSLLTACLLEDIGQYRARPSHPHASGSSSSSIPPTPHSGSAVAERFLYRSSLSRCGWSCLGLA
jgi:hypothetical protein